MAVTVTQDIVSSYVPNRNAELRYTIRGATSEANAVTELTKETVPGTPDYCPYAFQAIPRLSIRIDCEHIDSLNSNLNIWRATVNYAVQLPELEDIVSFDTTGGTQNITQSYATNIYPAGAANFQGAINYDGQKVNGIDIIIPAYQFTEQHYKSPGTVDESYRSTLAALTGCVNDSTYRGHAAGEVLFKGVSGQQVYVDSTQKWQLSFTFAVSPNKTGIVVGSITGIAKKGWEYLWVLYKDGVNANTIIKEPSAVYVEQVYDYGDFDDLDI